MRVEPRASGRPVMRGCGGIEESPGPGDGGRLIATAILLPSLRLATVLRHPLVAASARRLDVLSLVGTARLQSSPRSSVPPAGHKLGLALQTSGSAHRPWWPCCSRSRSHRPRASVKQRRIAARDRGTMLSWQGAGIWSYRQSDRAIAGPCGDPGSMRSQGKPPVGKVGGGANLPLGGLARQG